ncbi:hypothetical protein BBP40_004199 [Aspergillus hancockii]|nr:hypothetical protein BBP40_004199 [Aspergillus hancockii]
MASRPRFMSNVSRMPSLVVNALVMALHWSYTALEKCIPPNIVAEVPKCSPIPWTPVGREDSQSVPIMNGQTALMKVLDVETGTELTDLKVDGDKAEPQAAELQQLPIIVTNIAVTNTAEQALFLKALGSMALHPGQDAVSAAQDTLFTKSLTRHQSLPVPQLSGEQNIHGGITAMENTQVDCDGAVESLGSGTMTSTSAATMPMSMPKPRHDTGQLIPQSQMPASVASEPKMFTVDYAGVPSVCNEAHMWELLEVQPSLL